jgi:hypothetical protein
VPASRFDQPALEPADEPPAGTLISGRGGAAHVLFLDGTWRLCRIRSWQRDRSGRWRVLLRWGVSGELVESWYVHDRERVRSANS